jgi:hypothetical protein
MAVPRPRPLRSTTLLSGSSSISQQPALELCLRRSLPGHWTLIEPLTHKAIYYFSPQLDEISVREIRRDSHDGPLLATVSLDSTPTHCHLAFCDEQPNIELKLGFRWRYRFTVGGRKLYWKKDTVCRESRTRRVFADTDGDTLIVYEGAEGFLDVIVATFLAMKFKCQHTSSNYLSWLNVTISFIYLG